MALPYYIYQDNRKSVGTNLWYARATHYGILSLEDLAKEVQRNCSLKLSDCIAVNTELVEVILNELRNSMKVELGDFGYFTPAVKSKGAIEKKDFTPSEFIRDAHVNFVAKWGIEKTNGKGKSVRQWTQGTELKQIPGPLWASDN